MSVTTAILVCLLTQAGTTPNTLRLTEGAARQPATIADVAWMAGAWHGAGLGGEVDEVWSAPSGGAMVGHFRLVRDGKPIFYEIMTLLEREGSVEMRLKHVNADMTGWEEKSDFVTFKLIRFEADALYFSGLTFKRSGDTLTAYLALRDSAGTVREETFTMRRAR